MEVWKDVVGYENIYQISSHGNVRSLDRIIKKSNGVLQITKGITLKINYNCRTQRPYVHLYKDDTRIAHYVYKLVCQAFKPNPMSKPCVNHIDGDIKNCNADNLEWVNYSENLKHSYGTLHRVKNSTSIKRRHCILIDKINNCEIEFNSIAETHRFCGISETQIRRISDGICINDKYDFKIS